MVSRKQYMMLGVEVFLHLLIFAGVPLFAMGTLLNVQTVYAMTTASTSTPALSGWDLLLRPTYDGVFLGYDIAPVVAIGWSIMAGYLGLVLVRLTVEYSHVFREGGIAKRIVRMLFAWATVAIVGLCVWQILVVQVWFILAAALNPSKNLPFGAGVVTVIGIASLTYVLRTRNVM